MTVKEEKFSTTCTDGVTLHGMLLIPEQPKAVVQFNAGTGIKKEFYKPFLSYLAENGYVCCLWDYRGIGESAPPSLKGCRYTFSEYGTLDMPAIRDFLKNRFPKLPLILVGHSAGGQQVGLIPNLEDYAGLLAIAVSTGYEPQFHFSYRLKSMFFFDVFIPISIALTGYVNSKPFGIMENLPKYVAKEWHTWCTEKKYLFSSKFLGNTIPTGAYDALPFPVHVFWATDDELGTERNIMDFWSHVKSKHQLAFTSLDPNELGIDSIGHFGFFKKRMEEQIWPMILNKIDKMF